MPITISYDLRTDDPNQRNYVRSMLERFHWRRLGGSVFRYDGEQQEDGSRIEDWLNHVIPALMFFRAYCLRQNIQLRFFTIDSASVFMVDFADPNDPFGHQPATGANVVFAQPTNNQSSIATIRAFVDAATAAAG